MPKENMKTIECGRCNVLVPLLNQFPVKNVPTFEYHCSGCHGKVHLQLVKNPVTGEAVAKQVRLSGSHEEFRPNPIRPSHQVQIPVAYTLGKAPSTRHVQTPPVQTPAPAYTLGEGGSRRLPEDHPMHPNQMRKRIQPIRWE